MDTQRDTQTQQQSRRREEDSQTNKIAPVKLRGEFDPLTAANTQSSDLILSLSTQEISKFSLFYPCKLPNPCLGRK